MGVWRVQRLLLFDGLRLDFLARRRLLNAPRQRRPYPARQKRVVFFVFSPRGSFCRQWRGTSCACHTAHDSSAAAAPVLSNGAAAYDGNFGGHVAMLLFQDLRFFSVSNFDGVLLHSAVLDAVVKVHDGDTAAVHKVDPLLIRHTEIRYDAASSYD
jgi:hypothetical protein